PHPLTPSSEPHPPAPSPLSGEGEPKAGVRSSAKGVAVRPGVRFVEEERSIEVKGRASVGDVELSENEWAKACNLRERYWLYVVYDCASPHPRLLRVQDPFAALLVRARGGVIINEAAIFQAAKEEGQE
ncbi:MAG: DUF3883 domain-containing protein, partial [Candidatus Binatia bacterium]